MAKKATDKSEEGEQKPPMKLVRRGLYRGMSGRAFQSVPFGETIVLRTGLEYEIGEQFAYLWKDPQFAAMFDWKSELVEVPAVNEGQVPPPA